MTHARQRRRLGRGEKTIPALAELAGGIGDQMVRNMGTLGGSIRQCRPGADPAGVAGPGATVKTNQRGIAADDFFTGLYETALNPGELITAVKLPPQRSAAAVSSNRRSSRFALVGVFVAPRPGKACACGDQRRAACSVASRWKTLARAELHARGRQ